MSIGPYTLTGSGVLDFGVGFFTPTDMDVQVTVLGPTVRAVGPAGHRALKYAGWLQFINTSYVNEEGVTDAIFINSEAQDVAIVFTPGANCDKLAYYVSPGTEVVITVSF